MSRATSRRKDTGLTRRSFVELLGAGVLLSATAKGTLAGLNKNDSTVKPIAGSVAARIHLGRDGTITVLTSKVEVGQGSRTQLTQAAAEELRVEAQAIRLVMADTAVVPNDGGTYGSLTTPRTVPAVRRAAATARESLLALARERLGGEGTFEVLNGVVRPGSSPGGPSVAYADLARLDELPAALLSEVPEDVELIPMSSWRVLGTSLPKVTAEAVVTGSHRYPSDIVRPGMLYGKVLRPPSLGAELTSVDLSPADELGATAFRDGAFVGCVAETSQAAGRAIEAINQRARWQEASHLSSAELSSDRLFETLERKVHTGENGTRKPGAQTRGEIDQGFEQSKRIFESRYRAAYIQHAPLEPRAAVAEWEGGKLTVYTGTQRPHGVRQELAEAFELEDEAVRVIVPDTGGGFGGKHSGECAVEAARLARAAKRPVSLRYTREEEFIWAYFRPAGLVDIKAGLDDNGAIRAWQFQNINSGSSALSSPYRLPHAREQFLYSDSPLRQGSYRGLAATVNTWARESMMDELAVAAASDPLEFRRRHIEDERLLAVLDAAAKRFRWGDHWRERPSGHGDGLACGALKGSYVAACVEVAVDRENKEIRVERIVQAFECGAIQNPDNLQLQVEGCIVMGLGGALSEEITFANGRISNPRFSQYRVPRFRDLPPIETVLVDRPDLPSAGSGETPIIAVAPAITNAVYHATRRRLRSLPLRL